MSSNATEGARPSAAPAGEAPTAERASAAPAEATSAGAASAGAASAGTASAGAASAKGVLPAEGAVATAAPARAPDAGLAAEPDTAPAEGVVHTAPAEGAPEPEHGFAAPGFTHHGFTEQGSAEREFAGADFTERDFAARDAQPVSKLAIVALVTGLVALVPIAVASGVAALIGIRRTGRGGHGMATAGLFLSAAWVIIAAAIVTVGAVTHGFHKPVTIKYREAAVFSLHEGDCVDSPNAQLVSILPCSTPHQAEVFATFALPASHWPGTAAIATEASSGCGSRLNSYLNPQLAISLTQSYVYPDQVAWTAGTRTVVCEVRASSGNLTGSVRGATLAEN
jgi:Septum formation